MMTFAQTLFVTIFFGNIVLQSYVGIDSLLLASPHKKQQHKLSAFIFGMGFVALALSYVFITYVLVPNNLVYLELVVYATILAILYVITHAIFENRYPEDSELLKKELPYILVNAIFVFAMIQMRMQGYDLVYALSVPLAFIVSMYVVGGLQERVASSPVPNAFKGLPIMVILVGCVALAMSGLSGIL